MFPDFTRKSGTFASSASRPIASPKALLMTPPTAATFSCCVRPPEAVDGRVRVRGLIVRDDEIELPTLPAPVHAAGPVDLVHRQGHPGADLDAPRREVPCQRRKCADLDRAPPGGPARLIDSGRPARSGNECRQGTDNRKPKKTVSRPASFRRSCQRPGLPTTRHFLSPD